MSLSFCEEQSVEEMQAELALLQACPRPSTPLSFTGYNFMEMNVLFSGSPKRP